MHRNGQLWRAVSYTTVSAIIAFCMAYWPASAGNILAKFNIVPTHLTSASDIPDRTHKADRFPAITFEQRWSALCQPQRTEFAAIAANINSRRPKGVSKRSRLAASWRSVVSLQRAISVRVAWHALTISSRRSPDAYFT